MAKKKRQTRTPPPPRPVQAGRRRGAGPRTPFGPRQRTQIFWGLALVGVIAVVAVVLAVVLPGKGTGGASSASVAKTMVAAGCTYRDVKPLPPKDGQNYHNDVPTLTSNVKWSTSPPSGGGHYALWAVWGFYTQPVNPRQVVHNEEHGAVVMWWGSKVPKSEVDQLAAFYQSLPDGMFGTPYPSLGSKIALTAWTGTPSRYYQNHYYGIGHIAICPRFDKNAFTVFRDAYRGHGPEGIPLSADEPGMGPNG
jgi:hypothetical protein